MPEYGRLFVTRVRLFIMEEPPAGVDGAKEASILGCVIVQLRARDYRRLP